MRGGFAFLGPPLLPWEKHIKRGQQTDIATVGRFSKKKIQEKIWIFEEVSFFFTAEIGFFGLTWRVMLL